LAIKSSRADRGAKRRKGGIGGLFSRNCREKKEASGEGSGLGALSF
jgi:hypothetical protein